MDHTRSTPTNGVVDETPTIQAACTSCGVFDVTPEEVFYPAAVWCPGCTDRATLLADDEQLEQVLRVPASVDGY